MKNPRDIMKKAAELIKPAGPAEKLGRKVDKTVQNAKDVARDVKDDLTKNR